MLRSCLVEADKNGELSKEVGHWLGADENSDGMLNRHEFLAFLHPEHNVRTIKIMAEDMIKGYDKNKDGVSKFFSLVTLL